MAKQIKRFGTVVLLITLIGVLILVPFAEPQEGSPPPAGDPQIAEAIRRTVSFGPIDVLPALAGDIKHRAMIDHARSFVADHEAELAPVVAGYNSARDGLVHAITWGEGIEEARQAEQAARLVIMQAVADMLPGMNGQVPPPLQALIDRVLANGQLDPDLRCLNLAEEQRAAILAAQHERDAVLRNARNWYQVEKNTEATETFEETVQSILTQAQRSELASAREALSNRLDAMMTAEAEPFNDG